MPVPVVVTMTLPDASSVSRSPALRTAFLAVGSQTPPEHIMFAVWSEEMVTEAIAVVEAIVAQSAQVAIVAERQRTETDFQFNLTPSPKKTRADGGDFFACLNLPPLLSLGRQNFCLREETPASGTFKSWVS